MKTKTEIEKMDVINTMISQMGNCGVNQGYLEVRGLSYINTSDEMKMGEESVKKLNMVFNDGLRIICWLNEGKDLYECVAKMNGKEIYKNEEVFCEDWKRVFEEIFKLRVSK